MICEKVCPICKEVDMNNFSEKVNLCSGASIASLNHEAGCSDGKS